MTTLQTLLLHVGSLALATILVGLTVNGRSRRCLTFTLYLAAVLTANVLIGIWPATFRTWNFWLAKETTHSVLKFAVALELGLRIFRALPHAKATMRAAALLVLGLTGAAAVFAPIPPNEGSLAIATDLMPRVQYGTAWLFGALLAIVLWYRVPLDPWHKAILTGLVAYLLAFTLALHLLRGSVPAEIAGYLNAGAYLLLLAWWAYAAWRREPATPADPEEAAAVQRLQPWR